MRAARVRTKTKTLKGVPQEWRGVFAVLCALTLLLTGCDLSKNVSGATSPARSTLTPLPAIAANAPLHEQLHLRTIAPEALSLIVQPDDGRGPIVDALNAAQTSIDLEIYLLTDREVIYALETAVNRGVIVRVMMEPNPCCTQNNTMQRSVYAELQEARVQTQWANPAFRLTHAKMMIVDGGTAFIMSQNLTKSSFQYNREASIVSHDTIDVGAAQAIFDADWNRTTLIPGDPNFVIANINARAKLLTLINGATRSLVIESEEMQDGAIVDALIAAQRRGVSVRYIGSTAPPGNAPVITDTNAPGRKRLTMSGASVKNLAIPYIHTTTVLADGAVAYVGSVNFSTASLDNNREVGFLTDNKAVISRLETVFTKDWSAAKTE